VSGKCDLDPSSVVEHKWGQEAAAGGMPLKPGVDFSIVIRVSSTGFEVTIDGLHRPEFDFSQRIAGNVTAVELQSTGSSGLSLYSTVALKPTAAPTTAALPTVRQTQTPVTPRPLRMSSQLPDVAAAAADPRPRTDADDAAGITLPPDAQIVGRATGRQAHAASKSG
jgi:hypothetical protein